MTSRERILTAVRLEVPDRVPVCPRGVQPLRQIYGGEWPSASDMIRASRDFDFDCVVTWSPGEKLAPDVRRFETTERTPEGIPVRLTVLESKSGRLERRQFAAGPMTDGAFASSLTSATGAMIKNEADLKVLESLYAPTQPEDVKPFVSLENEMGACGIVQGEVANPINLAVRDVGVENLMIMYMDDPEFVFRLLAVYQRMCIWQIEALLDAGAKIIYSDGVWCTADLWSPQQIEAVIAPLIREQTNLVHEAGAYYHLFIDGNCMAALERIANMGVDILSPLETPPSADANVAEAKRRIGNRVCLWGGVNAYWDIMHGSVERVREAVREAIEAGAPGGGYVLSTADSIYEPCPLENVREFFRAGREFGRYSPANSATIDC